MKRFITLALAAVALGSAQAQPNVSISVHQPGVYGRIDIGGMPPPALVLPQPVLIAPPAVVVQRQPIYLYVPPMHQQNWRRYCGRYNACGQPVYFVQENWYNNDYAPRHGGHGQDDQGERHGEGHGRGHGKGHKKD